MFKPKEAQEDGYILGAALAVLIGVGAFILLSISFDKGFRYGLLLWDKVQTEGVVTQSFQSDEEFADGVVVLFQFDDLRGVRHEGEKVFGPNDASEYRPGQSIDVVFNPRFPQYYVAAGSEKTYSSDFLVSIVFICMIIACFAYIVYQMFGYIRFKKMMKYY